MTQAILDDRKHDFYVHAMDVLEAAQVPYMVGGGYAMVHHTGIPRQTKDLDLLLRQADVERALEALAAAGYRTELTRPTWLVKAIAGEDFIDILFSSGNGLCVVDDLWMDRARFGLVLGRPSPVSPPEEIIWSKAFVQERDRFDGADVAHLVLAKGHEFDWRRLIDRFGEHSRVLLAHLVLFGYIFPSERWRVPEWVMGELLSRMRNEEEGIERICRGTLLSVGQFEIDVKQRGFIDVRGEDRT